MNKIESLEEFYKKNSGSIPENFSRELGHFNIFKISENVNDRLKPLPYQRRDYFKITFLKGNPKICYADKVIQIKKHALIFSNPYLPYTWDSLYNVESGTFCIFNNDFFHQYGNLSNYPIFKPDGTHVFEIPDELIPSIELVYKRMFEEIESDYAFKYDLLRNLTQELFHIVLKMQPSDEVQVKTYNSSQRIADLFFDLLERQFPIDDSHPQIKLKTPADFADHLNIHVNHLNKALKDVREKTTSQAIAERIMQESKILLRQSSWNVSEIGYSLGFSEVAHFNTFFKKHAKTTPLRYRNI